MASRNMTLETMSEPRQAILTALKAHRRLGIGELSERLRISYEGVRQHLRLLQQEGWVTRSLERHSTGPGRPRSSYRLTAAGDHLFPKEYDRLAVQLLDAAEETLGAEAVKAMLETVTRHKVEQWRPALRSLSMEDRLRVLTAIYTADDPHCMVDTGEGGQPQLVEMNCPYLEVARKRPALCSVTVSVLRQLLGHEVVRTERFQAGHGRCVFEVLAERLPADSPLFDWEQTPATADSQ